MSLSARLGAIYGNVAPAPDNDPAKKLNIWSPAGFAGHRHASRIDRLPSGEIEAHIVTASAGGPKERFRVRTERIGSGEGGFDQKRFDYRSEAVMKARIHAATDISGHAISIDPGKPQHGRDGVTWQLNRLIERRGPLVEDRGKAIGDVAAARNAAKEWGRSLRSQSPPSAARSGKWRAAALSVGGRGDCGGHADRLIARAQDVRLK